jgi:hypothetical protein
VAADRGRRSRSRAASRLRIDPGRLRMVGARLNWSLENHIERVYDEFHARDGRLPVVTTREGELRPGIQQSLMDWNADLGARHRMDWDGFLKNHRRILRPLLRLPRLGRLDRPGVERVCQVVETLESFKQTRKRSLVFGTPRACTRFRGCPPNWGRLSS